MKATEQTTHSLWPVIGICAGIYTTLTLYCYFVGLSLLIPVILAVIGFHLHYFKKSTIQRIIHLTLLLALILFGAHAIQTYTSWSLYIIPIASVVMLTMLLFNDLQLSFVIAFASSTIVGLALGMDLGYVLTFFVGGVVSAYAVKGARTRGQLINAGLLVGLLQALCGFLLNPEITKATLLGQIQPLFINGFVAAFVVLALLKIFEIAFGEITNFSLLELSDSINQPLLKKMALEAPGTYHHSLIVSNLSGTAADAIGANALLTRVGGYYHDIGKMVKPEYFTENQMMMSNKHDKLEPSMSHLVIVNHVKEGVEMAKKNKLNQKIIDFIPQHHGTSVMHFFYQKALEEKDDKEEVVEDSYRYPGPKPQTRETAILMLADSVEGATRALDEHTPGKIDEIVRRIVNNKFIDGQLDECNLTLREIEIISSTFTRVLSAMYHGRVKYPEKKSNGNGSKSSKENSHSNGKDQGGSAESSDKA